MSFISFIASVIVHTKAADVTTCNQQYCWLIYTRQQNIQGRKCTATINNCRCIAPHFLIQKLGPKNPIDLVLVKP